MVLDPLSAFSVACNIFQVIELGSKVLSNAVDYGKATSGVLPEHQDLRNVLQSLQSLNADLRTSIPQLKSSEPSNTAISRLVEANNECLRLSTDFVDLLDRLKVRNRQAVLQSLRMSIKTLWYREKLDAFEKNLSRARDNLNVAFLLYITSTQATAARQNENLKSSTRMEGSILKLVDSSSASIKNDIRLLAEQLEKTHLDSAQQQTISEFSASNHTFLKHFSDRLVSILSQQNDLQAHQDENQRVNAQQKVLDSLRFPQIQERRDRVHAAYKNTYQWILRPDASRRPMSNSLLTWLSSSSESRRIYWICGKPGSGKSTLMKFLDENIDAQEHMLPWVEDAKPVRAQCFFWHPGHTLQKSMEGLLRSLLMQLLEQMPDLIYEVVASTKWRAALTPSNNTIDWSHSELQYSLRECLARTRNSAKVLLLIDGLDEFEGTDEMRDNLVGFLKTLANLENIKICLSSRPWNAFQDVFGDCPQLRLEDLTFNDISEYVGSQLRKHQRLQYLLSHEGMDGEKLISTITNKAEGVFLWVRLVVRDLLKGLRDGDSVHTLWKTLEEIPADLNDYFKCMMNSISPEYRQEASILLQIALHKEEEFVSLHPLRLLDLTFIDERYPDFALREQFNFHRLDLSNREGLKLRLDSTLRRLNSRCMGLLGCLYDTDEDFFDLYGFDLPEEVEILAPKTNISFEPAVYSRIFEGPNLLLPFMLTVDFLHRSYQDFLLGSEGQNLLHSYTNIAFDARTFLFNARLAQFIALTEAKVDQELALGLASYLMSILSLRNWRNTSMSVVAATKLQPAIEGLMQDQEPSVTVWYIDRSRASWFEEKSSFFTLALDFNLSYYVKTYLTPDQVYYKQGRPILDYILRPRFADSSRFLGIGNLYPDLEILHQVLDYGANPNEIYNGISVWALFLIFVADLYQADESRDCFEKQSYFNALAALIHRGANLFLPQSWLSDEGQHPIDTFYSFHSKRIFDRWSKSLPAIEANMNGVSEPWYAVSDLLENFRQIFGVGIDQLKILIESRHRVLALEE